MENKTQCTCCAYYTIEYTSDVCPVCFWQDDAIAESPYFSIGGVNGNLTLWQAIANFKEYGACELASKPFVRAPNAAEMEQASG